MLIPLYFKCEFTRKTTLFLAAIYIIYEIAYYYGIGTENKLIDTTFYYMIPYGGVLTYLGFNYSRIKKKNMVVIISFSVFLCLLVYYWVKLGSFQSVQISKYPPRLYYLSFGIAVSYFLFMICEGKTLKVYQTPVVTYISKHSMWIYLWHILVLSLYRYARLPEKWYIKLVVVYSCSIAIVFLVNKALDYVEARKNIFLLKYLRG